MTYQPLTLVLKYSFRKTFETLGKAKRWTIQLCFKTSKKFKKRKTEMSFFLTKAFVNWTTKRFFEPAIHLNGFQIEVEPDIWIAHKSFVSNIDWDRHLNNLKSTSIGLEFSPFKHNKDCLDLRIKQWFKIMNKTHY